jgi:hypothetical protein
MNVTCSAAAGVAIAVTQANATAVPIRLRIFAPPVRWLGRRKRWSRVSSEVPAFCAARVETVKQRRSCTGLQGDCIGRHNRRRRSPCAQPRRLFFRELLE